MSLRKLSLATCLPTDRELYLIVGLAGGAQQRLVTLVTTIDEI
jgi:hypothetical protein